MNIISFEERTFEGIAAKFEYFVQRVDNLCRRHCEKKIDVPKAAYQSEDIANASR